MCSLRLCERRTHYTKTDLAQCGVSPIEDDGVQENGRWPWERPQTAPEDARMRLRSLSPYEKRVATGDEVALLWRQAQ